MTAHVGSNAEKWHISPIKTGKFNQSYWAESPQGRFVLRVAPSDKVGVLFYERRMMRQEPALHALVRQRTAIPVPEIVAADFSRTLIDRDFLILEALDGVPLSEDERLTHDQRSDVLRQVGHLLGQLHTITGSGYGYDGSHQAMQPQPTWQQAFSLMWRKLIADVQACGMYVQAEADDAVELLRAYEDYFERDVPPALLHMDVWSQNILVDGSGQVTGLIDFDRALWGDPEIEFAVLDYCAISGPSFWEGYQSQRPSGQASQIRRIFYLLYEIQKYMPICIWRNGNLNEAEDHRQQAMIFIKRLRAGL